MKKLTKIVSDYVIKPALGIGLIASLARSAEVKYSDNGQIYTVGSFSDIDKKYILAGKTPKISKEIDYLVRELNKNGQNVTARDLLDGEKENNELLGISIDETDVFDPITSIFYEDGSGEVQSVGYSGFGSSNKMFLSIEIDNMNLNVKDGLRAQENYQILSSSEIKTRLVNTLDRQAGKVKGATSRWSPRFEYQMGFGNEEEFRKALENSKEIDITYDPHSSWRVGNADDFKVTYHLNDRDKLVKYVGELPLSVLEGHGNYGQRSHERFEERKKVKSEAFEKNLKPKFRRFKR